MDKVTFILLNLFSSRSVLSTADVAAISDTNCLEVAELIQSLIDCKYLRIVDGSTEFSFDTKMKITYAGRVALELEVNARNNFKYGEIRAWITLIIAIAAFIKSFFF